MLLQAMDAGLVCRQAFDASLTVVVRLNDQRRLRDSDARFCRNLCGQHALHPPSSLAQFCLTGATA